MTFFFELRGESLKESKKLQVKDLKSLSLKEVCSTFSHHEACLTFDLVTEKQYEAMVEVAVSKLAQRNFNHKFSTRLF